MSAAPFIHDERPSRLFGVTWHKLADVTLNGGLTVLSNAAEGSCKWADFKSLHIHFDMDVPDALQLCRNSFAAAGGELWNGPDA